MNGRAIRLLAFALNFALWFAILFALWTLTAHH